jgi:signal peptidase
LTVSAVHPPPAEADPQAALLGAPERRGLDLAQVGNRVATALLVFAVLALVVINLGPLLFPYRIYTVLSGSMEPTIPVGAQVVVLKIDASEIHVGDIITFDRPSNPGVLITHRVVAAEPDGKGGTQWITKGDNNSIPDSWRIPAQGPGYRYLFHVPFAGYLFAMLQSPLGRICFILAPALLLAAVVVNDFWKAADKRRAEATS